jgi:hypothetical protein
MRESQSQSHDHVVFVPKYRLRANYGTLQRRIGDFRELCRQVGVEWV